MIAVWWMIAGSVLSGLVAGALTGTIARSEVWLGMFAPLVVVCATWILTERVDTRHPERLTSAMISAFAGKLVFFGAYVWLAVGVLRVQPVPFVTSFTSYFIALHLLEALYLKRLFTS